MSEISSTPAYKTFQETRKRLGLIKAATPVDIDDMTLEELLEAERKFLMWYPETKHPDKEVKKHIYQNYIKPRIESLQLEKAVALHVF